MLRNRSFRCTRSKNTVQSKILKEIREMKRNGNDADSLLTARKKKELDIITKMYCQLKNRAENK